MSSNIPITGSFTKMSLSASPPVSSSFDLNMSRMSTSPGYSTSPPDHFTSGRTRRLTRSGTENVKQLKPFASADIKIRTFHTFVDLTVVLLENVAQTGVDILKKQGYQVRFLRACGNSRLSFIRLHCLKIDLLKRSGTYRLLESVPRRDWVRMYWSMRRIWCALDVSVSARIRLIWSLLQRKELLYSTVLSAIRGVWPSWLSVRSLPWADSMLRGPWKWDRDYGIKWAISVGKSEGRHWVC